MSHRKRRLKRSHLKRYSANIIGGTSGIDKHYFREAAMRATADATFKDRLPVIHEVVSTPINLHICLYNRVYHKLFMYWNQEYTRFYFVKQERTVAHTSISYPSRERAMRAYHRNRIIFKNPV